MSLSTQVLQIKPKTGALPSWNMRIIGQLPWPGGSFCQVRTPPQRGDFSTPSCLPQAAVLLSKGNKRLLFVFFCSLSLVMLHFLNSWSFLFISQLIQFPEVFTDWVLKTIHFVH